MATAAHRRLIGASRAARTVTVKVRGADFSVISRSESLPAATTDLPTLVAIARRLVRVALPETAVRLIGVAYTGLSGQAQEALFSLDAPAHGYSGVESLTTAPTDPSRPAIVPTDPSRPTIVPTDPSRPTIVPAGPLPRPAVGWRPGDDVEHSTRGHGWVQGAGHGRVTVRFESRSTGPGSAATFDANDPELNRADPLRSLD
jgi:DNA polymerase IV